MEKGKRKTDRAVRKLWEQLQSALYEKQEMEFPQGKGNGHTYWDHKGRNRTWETPDHQKTKRGNEKN